MKSKSKKIFHSYLVGIDNFYHQQQHIVSIFLHFSIPLSVVTFWYLNNRYKIDNTCKVRNILLNFWCITQDIVIFRREIPVNFSKINVVVYYVNYKKLSIPIMSIMFFSLGMLPSMLDAETFWFNHSCFHNRSMEATRIEIEVCEVCWLDFIVFAFLNSDDDHMLICFDYSDYSIFKIFKIICEYRVCARCMSRQLSEERANEQQRNFLYLKNFLHIFWCNNQSQMRENLLLNAYAHKYMSSYEWYKIKCMYQRNWNWNLVDDWCKHTTSEWWVARRIRTNLDFM